MLFQPSNITPDILSGSGEGTVDASSPASVTWQVNGTSAMTAFRIKIYLNDTASTLVYDTTKITVSPSFYGTDAKGNIVPYTYAFGGATWASLGLSNGKDYKLSITQYYNDGTEQSVSQYSASAFMTRSTPSVSISVSSTVSSVVLPISASYSQAQGDAIAFVRWALSYSENGTLTQIDDTGFITTGVLSYTAEGLIDGKDYNISLTVVSSTGQTVTATANFSVVMTQQTIQNKLVGAHTFGGAVELSWNSQKQVEGAGSGTYSFSGGKLVLASGASVTYNSIGVSPDTEPMDFTNPYTAAIKTQLSAPLSSASASAMVVGVAYSARSHDGQTLATVSSYGVEIYEYNNGFPSFSSVSLLNVSSANGVCFTKDGRIVVTASTSPYFTVIEKLGGSWSVSYSSNTVYNVAFYAQDAGSTTRGVCLTNGSAAYILNVGASSITNDGTVYISLSSGENFTCAAMRSGTAVVCTNKRMMIFSVDSGGSSTLLATTYGDYTSVNFEGNYIVALDAHSDEVVVYNGSQPVTRYYTGTAYTDVSGVNGTNTYALLYSGGFEIIKISGGKALSLGTKTVGNSAYQIQSCADYVVLFGSSANELYLFNTDSESTFLRLTTGAGNVDFRQTGTLVRIYSGGTLVGQQEKDIGGGETFAYYQPQYYSCGIEKAAHNFSQGKVTRVKLYGVQTIDFFELCYGSVDIDPANPTFTTGTFMLTAFQNSTLDAGAIDFTGGYVFRLESNSPTLDSVLSYTPTSESNRLRDYGVKACKQYTYEVFFTKDGGQTVSQIFESDEKCAAFDGVYLYEAQEDENNPRIFHVVKIWHFNAGYSIDGYSNNNNPQFFENFTPYRFRQKGHLNAFSGTLTALLGTALDNDYNDSAELMRSLAAASLSNNVFFLKDPKGLLLMVHIASPIQQSPTFSTVKKQVTVRVPFEEVGDAEEVALIMLPSSPVWDSDFILGTRN